MITLEETVAKYREDKAREKKHEDERNTANLKKKIDFDFGGRYIGQSRIEQLGLTFYPDRAEFVFKSVVYVVTPRDGSFKLSYPQPGLRFSTDDDTMAYTYAERGELWDTIMVTLGTADA